MNEPSTMKWNPHHTGPNNIATGQHYYHYSGGESWMFEADLLLDGADQVILNYVSCAEVFLTRLKSGTFSLHQQVRYLTLIHDLYERIRTSYSPFHKLMPLFLEAMDGLVKLADSMVEDVPKNTEECSEYFYGYNDWDDIHQALMTARNVAIAGMFKEFARQYSHKDGFSGDLFGQCTFILSEPRYTGFAKHFSKTFQWHGFDHACFRESDNGTWKLDFIKLIPMPHRYMLELAAYEAAAPFLGLALCVDAKVEHGLCEYSYE